MAGVEGRAAVRRASSGGRAPAVCGRWSDAWLTLVAKRRSRVQARYERTAGSYRGGSIASVRRSRRRAGASGEFSMAWRWFGLVPAALRAAGGTAADWLGRVDVPRRTGQLRARLPTKGTWLYAVGCELPSLAWGDVAPAELRMTLEGGRLTAAGEERQKLQKVEYGCQSSDPRRRITPAPFRDVLIQMARSVGS